jgi:hypothetical protein
MFTGSGRLAQAIYLQVRLRGRAFANRGPMDHNM